MDKNKIRYIIGIICIIGSFGGMSSGQPLPAVFMLLFGISLLPIIYEKIEQLSKINKAEIIVPVIVFVIFVITIGATSSSTPTTNESNQINNSNNNVIAEENNNVEVKEENKTVEENYVLDVPSLANISYNQLTEKMGQADDTDTYTVSGKTAKIYYYDNEYEFMFYNDKLIRITIWAYEFEELKNLNEITDFCKKLNIKDYSTNNRIANTGYTIRYKDLTDKITEFRVNALGEPDSVEIKITFDTNGFDL